MNDLATGKHTLPRRGNDNGSILGRNVSKQSEVLGSRSPSILRYPPWSGDRANTYSRARNGQIISRIWPNISLEVEITGHFVTSSQCPDNFQPPVESRS